MTIQSANLPSANGRAAPASPARGRPAKRPTARAKLVGFATIVAEAIAWLWRGWLPLGKIVFLVGPPGLGKTAITAWFAAAISTGRPFPDGQHGDGPGVVLWINGEDDPADTLLPRLIAAGGDPANVFMVPALTVAGDDGEEAETGVDLRLHLSALRDAIARASAEAGLPVKLLITDPANAFVGKTDIHNDADVRAVFTPIKELAAETGVTFLFVSHLNKGSGKGSLLDRMMGSVAFGAVARAVFLVCPDQNDPDRRRRYFLPLKANNSPDRRGLAFSIEEQPTDVGPQPVVRWESEPVEITPADALDDQHDDSPTAVAECVEFLEDLLRDGPKAVKQVEDEAHGAGHAKRTLERARKQLDLKPLKITDGGRAYWALDLTHTKGKSAKPPRHPNVGGLGGLRGDAAPPRFADLPITAGGF